MDPNLIKGEFQSLQPMFFNTAYIGPVPSRARKEGLAAIEEASNPVRLPFETWKKIPDQVRQVLSQLINVPWEQISHHSAVSEVISTVSLGYPFQGQDHVAIMNGDYPSNVIPWMLNQPRMGFQLDLLSPQIFRDPNQLFHSIHPQTKILNLSHVTFNTGCSHNIAAIGAECQKRGILFVVDVSQSLGGIELTQEEVQVCDVIVGASYKWLLGPYGHAYAYWSNRALEKIKNTHLSWQVALSGQSASSLLQYTDEPLPGARRMDRGQAPQFITMRMLLRSLEFLNQVGLPAIEKHNKGLVDFFLSNIPPKKFDVMTPIGEHRNIISLKQKDSSKTQDLEDHLRAQNIESSIREGNLRLSFHLFNTKEEVESLLQSLDMV